MLRGLWYYESGKETVNELMKKKQESNRPGADPGFLNGGHMSSAEGPSVEAPQAPMGWGLGGVSPSQGQCPLPRIFF